MSGVVRVMGSVSQSAGATGHGGLLVIEGDVKPAVRHLDEGRRHSSSGATSGNRERLHGPGGHDPVGGDAGHGPGRLALRGPALRGRRDRLARRGLRGSATLHEHHVTAVKALSAERRARPTSPGRVRHRGSARPAPCTTSRRRTRAPFQEPPPVPSRTFDRRSHRRYPRACRPRSVPHPRLRREARRCRTSTTCCSSAASIPATRSRATGSAATPNVFLGAPLARPAATWPIPVTIAGMKLRRTVRARPRRLWARRASEVGTSTTTGDGGMTPEERAASPNTSSTSTCRRATG